MKVTRVLIFSGVAALAVASRLIFVSPAVAAPIALSVSKAEKVPGPDFQPPAYFSNQRAAYQRDKTAHPEKYAAINTKEPEWFFTGKPYDANSKSYFFKYRNYRPDSASWMTPDPSGFPDGPNNYAYAPNPLSQFDRLGLTVTGTWRRENSGDTHYGDYLSWSYVTQPSFLSDSGGFGGHDQVTYSDDRDPSTSADFIIQKVVMNFYDFNDYTIGVKSFTQQILYWEEFNFGVTDNFAWEVPTSNSLSRFVVEITGTANVYWEPGRTGWSSGNSYSGAFPASLDPPSFWNNGQGGDDWNTAGDPTTHSLVVYFE